MIEAATSPVLPIRPSTSPHDTPLFCVHPAIGLAWCYAGLLAHLAPQRPVYGLQAPHVSGEDSFTSIPKPPDTMSPISSRSSRTVPTTCSAGRSAA